VRAASTARVASVRNALVSASLIHPMSGEYGLGAGLVPCQRAPTSTHRPDTDWMLSGRPEHTNLRDHRLAQK